MEANEYDEMLETNWNYPPLMDATEYDTVLETNWN